MVLVLTLIFGFAIAAVSCALVEAAVPPGPAALGVPQIAADSAALQADVLTYRNGKLVKAQGIADTALYERVWGTK